MSADANFGRYRAETQIGQGAMGTVYRGHDPALDRVVAIKVMRPADDVPQATRDEFRERFFREARAAASLAHPNIVAVYDVGVIDDGSPYLVMEFIPGGSLQALYEERGPLPSIEVARAGQEIALALGVAHAAGIVHRDVKPANILVAPDGSAKLMDFGIARIAESTLTVSGQFLGSPLFASPEQIKGLACGPPSDLFSLAVSLYRVLVPQHPFRRKTWQETARAIVQDAAPSPSGVRPDLDAAWDVFFGQALAKDPAGRFADAAEMAETLAKVGAGRLLGSTAPAAMAPAIDLVVEQGPDRGRSVPLTSTVEVGRGRGDLALSDNTVSSRHCRFTLRAGQIELTDHGSSNGTFVGDAPVTTTNVPVGTLVRLGTHTFVRVVAGGVGAAPGGPSVVAGTMLDGAAEGSSTSRRSPPRPSLARDVGFVLVVETGARPGAKLAIGDSLLLSRDEGPGRLDDDKVSRKHAMVEIRPGGRVYLRDLASSNGTWLDDQRIREVELRPGDRFRVGATVLRLDRSAE